MENALHYLPGSACTMQSTWYDPMGGGGGEVVQVQTTIAGELPEGLADDTQDEVVTTLSRDRLPTMEILKHVENDAA